MRKKGGTELFLADENTCIGCAVTKQRYIHCEYLHCIMVTKSSNSGPKKYLFVCLNQFDWKKKLFHISVKIPHEPNTKLVTYC